MEAEVAEGTDTVKHAAETFLLIVPSFFFMVVAVCVSTFLTHRYKTLATLLEFIIIVIPIILNVTVLSKYVTNLLVITCVLLGMHVLICSIYHYCKKLKAIKPTVRNGSKKDFITNCRATINLISVIVILAVDFRIFPRRFSKTTRTGFSLMDVGVGLFVFANGIVAPEVKGKTDSIRNSIKGSAILLIIGILRLILTKLTNYNVSDTEYGVHWNFFITLAFTKIFSSCILNVINIKYILLNAILITIGHETLLQISIKEWVFNSTERTNFLDANKEGLVSTIGYVALYLYSLYFSYSIKIADKNQTKFRFLLWTTITLTLTFFCNQAFEVSRRLANAGYIFWILFIGIVMCWLFYLGELGETVLFGYKLKYYVCSPHLYEAINYNGLIFFLIGNVLTGLVNLSITTKKVNSTTALLVLIIYMFVNCGVVYFLYRKKWKLKF